MAARLQLPVQLVQHDVAQQRTQRAALRHPLVIAHHHTVRQHNTRNEHLANQGQQPLVRNPQCKSRQQTLVMDSVEEVLQVDVDHPCSTFFQIRTRLPYRRVATAPGSEPMAARMKRRFELRLQHLPHRLLHHPVDHIGNTQSPMTSACLGNPHPPNIAGNVATRQQGLSQHRQQHRQMHTHLFDALSVRTRRPLVRCHCRKRST